MKKALIALAVLGLTGGAAVAQSSVTLFGVLDANVRYTKSSGQTLKKADSGLNTSRFGVRGTEDLGGGLKAGFWLESEVGVDNGGTGSGTFWARRSTVSLMGDFGEVRLGRNKTASRLHIEDFDPSQATGMGNVLAVYSSLGSTSSSTSTLGAGRADNLVSYLTPDNLGGFYAAVDVSAGEGAASNSTTTGKGYYGRAGFKQGALHVSGAYSSVGANSKYKLAAVGASYDLGYVKPSFNYSQAKYLNRKEDVFTIAATAPLGQGLLMASYTDAKFNNAAETAGISAGDAKLYFVGYVYNLSKRTALYTTYGTIDNNGAGKFLVAGSPTPTAGRSSSGFDVGIRHSF
ncbi:MAG: porin [Roseateles depolymerans]|uniref:Porin n=1 Tax=Roseateles depolymerans TaxID=76731 RepID=A0A2W5E3X0_9BURK|nr:MAG: porin [Roseateles depolymerans]